VAEVSKQYPKSFGFNLTKDPGVTGNLEVTIYNPSNPSNKQVVHAKNGAKQGLVKDDMKGFKDRLAAAIPKVRQF